MFENSSKKYVPVLESMGTPSYMIQLVLKYTALSIYRGFIQRYFGYNAVFSWTPNYFQKISVGLKTQEIHLFLPSASEVATETTGFI